MTPIPGGHSLFEQDPEAARIVAEMLGELAKHGLDAVRRYSRKFDERTPPSFELSSVQIAEAIDPVRQARDGGGYRR